MPLCHSRAALMSLLPAASGYETRKQSISSLTNHAEIELLENVAVAL